MKKLSKIVALLLAGALAMLMFTACSGGGTSADTEKEKEILKELGSRTEAASLAKDGKLQNNDSKLYIETKNLLDNKIEADTKVFGHLRLSTSTKGFDLKNGLDPTEKYLTFTVCTDYKTAGLVADLVAEITKQFGNIKDTNSNVKVDTTWANAAVVVKTTEKGSYAAIAIQVLNPAYND